MLSKVHEVVLFEEGERDRDWEGAWEAWCCQCCKWWLCGCIYFVMIHWAVLLRVMCFYACKLYFNRKSSLVSCWAERWGMPGSVVGWTLDTSTNHCGKGDKTSWLLFASIFQQGYCWHFGKIALYHAGPSHSTPGSPNTKCHLHLDISPTHTPFPNLGWWEPHSVLFENNPFTLIGTNFWSWSKFHQSQTADT